MKGFTQRSIRFFVYSNLFIAGCAVLMAHQTFSFLLKSRDNYDFLFFVFFSTICSYSFHWYLTHDSVLPSTRIIWLRKNRPVHVFLFFAGLAGSGFFFFYLLPYWPWLLLSAFITFLYSAPKIPHPWFRALRRVALGKTIFLALVWMYVTTILPVIIAQQQWKTGYLLFILHRFFLIYAICILFDFRDREDDKASGIRSFITLMRENHIFYLFAAALVVFAAATLLLLNYGYGLAPVMILLIPGLITAALYNYAKKHFADIFYYFVLDGLMAFSALLMLVPGI